MRECHAVGHAICVPPTEPFDLCVASCISNKTYVEPTPVYDHSLMLCKKQASLKSHPLSFRVPRLQYPPPPTHPPHVSPRHVSPTSSCG